MTAMRAPDREPAVDLDQVALAILLARGTPAAKEKALARASAYAAVMRGDRCPDCGGADCDDDGERGADLTFLCTGCGHRWMPAEEERTVAEVLSRDW